MASLNLIIMFSACLLVSAFTSCVLVSAFTADKDTQSLNTLLKSLNNPPKLKHWKLYGGDPCGEPWAGIECHGSSVIALNISHKSISGKLEDAVFSGLEKLQVIDLSSNMFTGNLPSFHHLKHLTLLNVSHNKFSGVLEDDFFHSFVNIEQIDLSSNMFTGILPSLHHLKHLKLLDLSYNNFSGGLPKSSLTGVDIVPEVVTWKIPTRSASVAVAAKIGGTGKYPRFIYPVLVIASVLFICLLVVFMAKKGKSGKRVIDLTKYPESEDEGDNSAYDDSAAASTSIQMTPKRGRHPPFTVGWCLYCDRQVDAKEDTFKDHCKKTHRKYKFRCGKCWNVFKTDADREMHMRYQNVV